MTAEVLLKLGDKKPAKRFIHFIFESLKRDKSKQLKIMYPINYGESLIEQELLHLDGYKNSKPVRTGNGAHNQAQHDIYGFFTNLLIQFTHSELIDINKDYFKVIKIAEELISKWREKDCSIWEFREKFANYTSSKAMACLALKNSAKLARNASYPELEGLWMKEAKIIEEEFKEKILVSSKESLTQAYEIKDLDASNLLLGRYNLLSYEEDKFKKLF